jgi:hypothetical protein
MKHSTVVLCLLGLVTIFALSNIHAQGTNRPAGRPTVPNPYPTATTPGSTPTPGTRTTDTSTTTVKTPVTFHDLTNGSTFYFQSDTNRAYSWVKLTEFTAKNTVNGSTARIAPEIRISQ